MSTQAATSHDLRSRVLRGFAWNMTSQITRQISRVIVGVLLARLLTPHDFGLAGMVLVFSSLVLVFSDLALGTGLVQRPHVTEEDRSTVFWTSFGVGICLTAAGLALSAPLSAFYGEPAVQPLFAVLSLSFVVTALGTTQAAVLQREMNFRGLELRMMAGTVAGGAIGISAAVAGYGAWALIAQEIALAVVSTTLLWTFSPWRPRLTYSVESLRDLGRFGLSLFGTRLLFYLDRNSDNLLIGRFLGSSALGAYALAYNIMLLPLSRLVVPIQETLFPALSRIQDDRDRMAAVWLRVNRFVAALVVPAMLGLAVVAPDFVRVVLGQRWISAVPVLQILALVALMQSLSALSAKVLTALGRTRTLLGFSIAGFAVTLPAFVIGLQWGIVGVAACYAVATLLVQPLLAWLTANALEISVWRFVHNLSGVAQASLVMFVSVWLARHLLIQADVAAPARLLVVVGIGVAVYLPACAWRAPQVLAELRNLLAVRARTDVAVAS